MIYLQSLIIPGTNIQLYDGSTISLSRYPGTKWIVHNGWYTYSSTQYLGWYLCSIPEQVILPADDSTLQGVCVISNTCPCPTPIPPYPPCPPTPFPPDIFWEIDRSWISVETISERDKLNTRQIPDGKIVRVNNDNGTPKYYIWSTVTNSWLTETFGIPVDSFVTNTQLQETIKPLYDSVNDLSSDISEIQSSIDDMTQDINHVQSDIEHIYKDIDDLETGLDDMSSKSVWRNIIE